MAESTKSVPARVELQTGIVVGQAGNRPLHADVFRAPPGDRPRPGVLLVHGGAWQVGDPSQLRGYGFLIGREGYTCVATEYRLTSEATWPAQLNDVRTAIGWMRSNAEGLGIDAERIVAFGASSGGHLALMAAMAPTTDQIPETAVQGVVSLYGITEVDGCPNLADASAALLQGCPPEAVEEASPARHVRPGLPPMLLFHSNRDDLVPRRQTFELYEALLAAGVPTELATFDGKPHAFDVDPRLGRQVASMTVSFIRRHVEARA